MIDLAQRDAQEAGQRVGRTELGQRVFNAQGGIGLVKGRHAQHRVHGAVCVEGCAAHAQIGHTVASARHHVDDLGGGGRCLGGRLADQIGHVDVADTHHIAPVFHRHAVFPLVQRTHGLEKVVVRIRYGLFPQILVHQTRLGALGERAEHGVFTPHDQVDRGIVRARTASVQDVLGVTGGQRAVASLQAQELTGISAGVAVEHRASHGLVHGFDECLVFGQAERGRVAVELGQFHVDVATGFQDATCLVNLRGDRLGSRHTLVDHAVVDLRQTGADRQAVAGG